MKLNLFPRRRDGVMRILGGDNRIRWMVVALVALAAGGIVIVVVVIQRSIDDVRAIGSYSDAELGIDSLAAESSMRFMFPYALHRTWAERRHVEEEEYQWARDEAVGYERERWWFERSMRSDAVHAYASLPVDVGAGGILEAAMHESFDECAADAGWHGVQLYDTSGEYVQLLETERGLPLSAYLDLRHTCSTYAMTFPTLGTAERDRLLRVREQHFVDAMRAYIEENPNVVVPLEVNSKARTPFNNMLVDICLSVQSRADQERCAEEYRIKLD